MKEADLERVLALALGNTEDDGEAGCPTTDELWGFVAKSLATAERERVHDHLAACSRCARDVVRLGRALPYARRERRAQQQRVRQAIAPARNLRAARPVWPSTAITRGLRWSAPIGVAAAALIVAVVWRHQNATPRVQLATNEPRPPTVVVTPPREQPQPDRPRPTPEPAVPREQLSPPHRHDRSPHVQSRPRPPAPIERILGDPLSSTLQAFIAFAGKPPEELRAPGEEARFTHLEPDRTLILSRTPTLSATPSDPAGPFTFVVNEVERDESSWIVTKSDVLGTARKLVDAPRMPIRSPLRRGKIYMWSVSVGEGEARKEPSALFMVAEQRTTQAVTAAKKRGVSPMRLARFYQRQGLYLEAVATIDDWLAKHPDDGKARALRATIKQRLNSQPAPPEVPQPTDEPPE